MAGPGREGGRCGNARLEEFDALNEERRISTVRDRVFTEALWSTYFNTAQLGAGIILLLAADLIREGTFTVEISRCLSATCNGSPASPLRSAGW